jgi:hypothetical protein
MATFGGFDGVDRQRPDGVRHAAIGRHRPGENLRLAFEGCVVTGYFRDTGHVCFPLFVTRA